MDLESYKEQLVEQLKDLRNRLQESELYIRWMEKYENLPNHYQKGILWGAIFIGVYLVYSVPASFVSSAEEKLSYFEENRQLTRELIRAGRLARTVQLPAPAPAIPVLQQEVENNFLSERVLPEQKLSVQAVPGMADTTLVPKSIEQNGLKANLKQLNLKQVVRIGEAMSRVESAQLMNIAIQADSQDPHYFSVDYEIATFSIPQASPPPFENTNNNRKKPSFNRRGRQ